MDGVVRPLHLSRRMARFCTALAADPEGPDLSLDRRHRRRADHFAPRATGWLPQLGLPLHVAARHASFVCSRCSAGYPRRRRRGATGGGGASPGPSQVDAVRHRRRAAAAGMGGAVARRLSGLAPGTCRQRRHAQVQLDVYGELMDALYQEMHGGLVRGRTQAGISSARWSSTSRRSGSSPMRAIGKCAVVRGISPSPRQWHGWRWIALSVAQRNSACREISINGASCALKSMLPCAARASMRKRVVSSSRSGGTALDASLLLLPLVGFLPPDDPRVKGTVDAIERELWSMAWCSAITRMRAWMDCPPAKACSWRAAFGWWTI